MGGGGREPLECGHQSLSILDAPTDLTKEGFPLLNNMMYVRVYLCYIHALQVGSEWDGKESIFRNHGNILGVWDEPVAAVRLFSSGSNFNLEIIWVDPVGVQVNTFTMKIESSWFVAFHKPKLERPIRPGLWSVTIRSHSEDIFRTDFLVVPLTHENKEVMSSPQALNAQRSGGVPSTRDKTAMLHYEQWRRNISKSGEELERWVDDLVRGYWQVREFCGAGAVGVAPDRGAAAAAGGVEGGGGDCSWVPDCTTSSWSTLSPDPKSEIGEVQNNGRLR